MIVKKKESFTYQTKSEEIANVVTHGLGFILSIIGSLFLLIKVAKTERILPIVCAIVYSISLIATYTTSTIYHMFQGKIKKILQRLDHISIYLLILGTYMPITLLVLQGVVGKTLFGIEGSLCLIGITFKAIFGPKFPALSGAFYLLMGWLVIFVIKPLVASLPSHALMWLFSGGMFYTLGFVFFALDQKFHFFHAIWHLFVMAGSFAHFFLLVFVFGNFF